MFIFVISTLILVLCCVFFPWFCYMCSVLFFPFTRYRRRWKAPSTGEELLQRYCDTALTILLSPDCSYKSAFTIAWFYDTILTNHKLFTSFICIYCDTHLTVLASFNDKILTISFTRLPGFVTILNSNKSFFPIYTIFSQVSCALSLHSYRTGLITLHIMSNQFIISSTILKNIWPLQSGSMYCLFLMMWYHPWFIFQ